jgi:hypothetical protein
VALTYNDAAHVHAVTHIGAMQKYWYDQTKNAAFTPHFFIFSSLLIELGLLIGVWRRALLFTDVNQRFQVIHVGGGVLLEDRANHL